MFPLKHRFIKVTFLSEKHIKIFSNSLLTYHQIASWLSPSAWGSGFKYRERSDSQGCGGSPSAWGSGFKSPGLAVHLLKPASPSACGSGFKFLPSAWSDLMFPSPSAWGSGFKCLRRYTGSVFCRLPLREGVDLNYLSQPYSCAYLVSLCVREWI